VISYDQHMAGCSHGTRICLYVFYSASVVCLHLATLAFYKLFVHFTHFYAFYVGGLFYNVSIATYSRSVVATITSMETKNLC